MEYLEGAYNIPSTGVVDREVIGKSTERRHFDLPYTAIGWL